MGEPTTGAAGLAGDVAAPSRQALSAALAPLPTYCQVISAHLDDAVQHSGVAAAGIVEQMTSVDRRAERTATSARRIAEMLERARSRTAAVTRTVTHLLGAAADAVAERDRAMRAVATRLREHAARSGAPRSAAEPAEPAEPAELVELADQIETMLDGDPLTRTATLTQRLAEAGAVQRTAAATLGAAMAEVVTAAHHLSEDTTGFVAETTNAIGHAQFQDINRQMIEYVMGAVADVRQTLENVQQYLDSCLAEADLLGRVVKIEELQHRHVMAQQRATHGAILGGPPLHEPMIAVELF